MTLKAQPYEVMVTGEKKVEFREATRWIESRLIDSTTGKVKQYDRVKFANGYGKERPSFTVSYKGYELKAKGVRKRYSNGLEVDTRGKPTYVIFLGDDVL